MYVSSIVSISMNSFNEHLKAELFRRAYGTVLATMRQLSVNSMCEHKCPHLLTYLSAKQCHDLICVLSNHQAPARCRRAGHRAQLLVAHFNSVLRLQTGANAFGYVKQRRCRRRVLCFADSGTTNGRRPLPINLSVDRYRLQSGHETAAAAEEVPAHACTHARPEETTVKRFK